ncbi:dynein axonemal intermediate chain 4 [Aricia agestis]|uniref:dynein axonemal intermediate chain 4 n=1 Tax=Aricia agestis TaxID=91739 RepID=UPI001C2023BA|nr:dynein axonemal intermediate chain 4 [Aricia agestis]
MSKHSNLQETDSSTSSKNASELSDSSKISSSKASKVTFAPIERRQLYKIIVDDVDYTPYDIIDTSFIFLEVGYNHAAFDMKTRARSDVTLKSRTSDVAVTSFSTSISLDNIFIDHTIDTEEGLLYDDVIFDVAPSAFALPKMTSTAFPSEILIVLKETETTPLFELPSLSCEKGTPEGIAVEQDNEYYQYITVGKGRNRKTVNEETQTNACITQTRFTLASRPQKKNAATFASLWDMHDTYAKLAVVEVEEPQDDMVLYPTTAAKYLRRKRNVDKGENEHRGKTFEEVSGMTQFRDALLLTERVLANMEYADAQKKFRGLVSMNPLSLDLVYIYSMEPLWTLKCEEADGRTLTSFSFNPKNKNILAVGYGKFTYAETCTGLICVWCTKNPRRPERIYNFPSPVTSVDFSELNPNWLACGFSNGDIVVLDVTSYSIKIVSRSKRDTNPCFEPIWSVSWRILDKDSQCLITTCQDGRINRFTTTKTHDFLCSPMMRLATVEGKLKGLQIPKLCIKEDVPIVMNPGALCVKWHPRMEHIYLVGTDDGCVHKCSTHYMNQHMMVFRAHSGPIYSIDVSPFVSHLIATCGADGAVRLWLEGVDEVILTLNCPAAVYEIAFCPVNSTIIIAASGNVLSIWDLRRKTHNACAEYTFPGQAVLTRIAFSPLGDNVFVGDTLGRLHTFHLEDTPIPPFYQRQLLDETIKKALCTRPHLLKQLEKLEQFG